MGAHAPPSLPRITQPDLPASRAGGQKRKAPMPKYTHPHADRIRELRRLARLPENDFGSRGTDRLRYEEKAAKFERAEAIGEELDRLHGFDDRQQ